MFASNVVPSAKLIGLPSPKPPVDSGHAFAVDGALTGTGALTKEGDGTLTLGPTSGASYTAPIDLQGGTLSTGALGDGSPINLADGSNFAATSSFRLARDFTLNGAHTLTVSDGVNFTS
ncbi:MAG: hypothetical protein AAGI90_07270, partial [Chlamydiota bacterium]